MDRNIVFLKTNIHLSRTFTVLCQNPQVHALHACRKIAVFCWIVSTDLRSFSRISLYCVYCGNVSAALLERWQRSKLFCYGWLFGGNGAPPRIVMMLFDEIYSPTDPYFPNYFPSSDKSSKIEL
jgi:hypothetical protein